MATPQTWYSQRRPSMSTVLSNATFLFNEADGLLSSGFVTDWTQMGYYLSTQLPEEQRFFEIEIDQACQLLANKYPYTEKPTYMSQEDYDQTIYVAWLYTLMNGMGWRVVPFAVCPSGQIMNSYTKKCSAPIPNAVDETVDTQKVIDETGGVQNIVTGGLLSGNMIYLAIAALALVFFIRKK